MASITKTSWVGRLVRQSAALLRGRMSAVALGLALVVPGCGNNGSSDPGLSDETRALRAQVLASLGQNVIVPRQEAFAVVAGDLETALAGAAASPGDSTAVSSARDAWREAMIAWQAIEMMQIGPAALRTQSQGGLDLRNRIYSWPDLNLCLVDQQTVEDGFDDPDVIAQTVGTPRGLWAIEYLLFYEATAENNCSPINSINQNGTWDAVEQAGQIQPRRLAYAAALGTLVKRGADELVAQWSSEGGNFIEELISPTRSGAVYGSAQEGLNAVSDALFYLDKETKDMKVGEPAGITMCETETCPERLESRWASHGRENVLANLRGFQAVFLGGDEGTGLPGYDDLLVDMGAADVANDMTTAIADAITATEAIPGTMRDALESDPPSVVAAHAAQRNVTDLLKSDFLSVLDLEAPARVAADID